MIEVEEFISFDNTRLHIEKSFVENSSNLCIIVHGLSEHGSRYQNISRLLNQNGFSVITFDNRGNARSGGKKGDCENFNDFLDDVHAIKMHYGKNFSRVFLIGHSLGGFIVNAYGAKYNDVDGIVSSGAVGIFLKQVKLLKFLPYKLFKNINIKNNLAKCLTHDEEVVQNYISDPLICKTNKLQLFGEVFINGIKYLQKNITNLTVPILYLHGSDDQIVPKESSQYLYEHVGSKDKKIIIYEEMYHEILNEIDKKQVYNDILEWLTEHAN